jgi:hypothetical protein
MEEPLAGADLFATTVGAGTGVVGGAGFEALLSAAVGLSPVSDGQSSFSVYAQEETNIAAPVRRNPTLRYAITSLCILFCKSSSLKNIHFRDETKKSRPPKVFKVLKMILLKAKTHHKSLFYL